MAYERGVLHIAYMISSVYYIYDYVYVFDAYHKICDMCLMMHITRYVICA